MANMDSEFVNLFLQKQKEALSETMSRCLMVESRLSINETKLQQLVETHKHICEEYERTRAALTAETEARNTLVLEHTELRARVSELGVADEDNKRLQKLINGLNVQVELLKVKLQAYEAPAETPNLK